MLDKIATIKNSFPFVNFDKAAIPASKVPVLFKTPIQPPSSNTKTIIPIESATPSIGALATFRKPCGC